ncbi:hypothetical protein CsSME_00050529 [Camellia sinensis var. sinensis]
MELNLLALCYPYQRPRHGGSAYVLLPGSEGSFMELVIRHVTRLRGICLESVFVSQPMCLPWRGLQ